MKNILYLHAGAEMYGADKVLLDLLKGLDKTQYHPVVVLPTEGVLVEAMEQAGIDVRVINYPIMRRKYFTPKGIIRYGLDLIKYNRQLCALAKEENIHLVHTNTAAVLQGCFVSRKMKIPQLWSIHEIIVRPKLMFRFTSWLIARFGTLTVTDSAAVKQHLHTSGSFPKDAVQVIYNGVDASRFHPDTDCRYLYQEWNIPENARIIGMMGRVNSWKGQHDFLQAAQRVMEKYDDVYTVFIGAAFEGEQWRETQLAEAIAQSPYADRIINRGYRTDSQGIYKLYDVFVLPSTNPDPLPTVVLEAMATGKPIVGYRHGGVCEMVKENHNGLLAEVRNPEDLAEKICMLLDNPELLKQMGENSRARLLEHFSMEAYIKNYSEAYDRLLQKS